MAGTQASLTAEQELAEEKLLDFYVKIMPPLMQCERCSIFVNSEKPGFALLKAGTGQRERSIEVNIEDNSIVGRVMESGRPIFEDKLQKVPGKHKYFAKQTGFETNDILCLPIKSRSSGKIIGAVQLLNHATSGAYSEDEIAFFGDLLDYLAFAIERPVNETAPPEAGAGSGPWKGIAIAAIITTLALAVPATMYLLHHLT